MDLTTLTAQELTALPRDRTPVILPLGSVEQHGPHLPLGTKAFLAEAVACEAARHLKTAGLVPLVAPTFPFTPCQISAGFPGCLSVAARTFSDLIFEVGQAFQREGFQWFYLVTMTFSPEAVKAIDVALGDLNKLPNFHAFDPMPLWSFSPNENLAQHLRDMGLDPAQELHADIKETGALLSLDPRLVRSEQLAALPPVRASPSWEFLKGNYSYLDMGAKDGYLGSPHLATPEIGRLFLDEAGLALAEAVRFTMDGNPLPPLPIQFRMLLKLIDLDEM
ncbi:MAG: Creatinine amidohydrolase [Candidatus Ozemobacter sibiricus]|jgi:creatinine amidohydrolase|uniref:Creatinine amidohydrolase n=1 Tax=Candidatus Ozemobacter sibiricus TaxID=2268124 RepID=A0A367ZKG8_9BACT|nr:MAG: Creatinine amidohydrolase [Candidatus Ozemobacter sibiricus]